MDDGDTAGIFTVDDDESKTRNNLRKPSVSRGAGDSKKNKKKKMKKSSRRQSHTRSGNKRMDARAKHNQSPSNGGHKSAVFDMENYRRAEALAGSFMRRGGRDAILSTPRKRSSRSTTSISPRTPASSGKEPSALSLHGGGGDYGTFGMETRSVSGSKNSEDALVGHGSFAVSDAQSESSAGAYDVDTPRTPLSNASTHSSRSRERSKSTPTKFDLDQFGTHNEHATPLGHAKHDDDGVVSNVCTTADSLHDSNLLLGHRLLPHMTSNPNLSPSRATVAPRHMRNISYSAPDLRQVVRKRKGWTPRASREHVDASAACHSRINMFQRRHGLPLSPKNPAAPDPDLQLTARALVIGSFFAIINAAVNMFFQFRYAGGLYQYWVILLSYPLGKLTELFPRGRILNPGPFLAKEHCIMMTIGIAGSVAGNLGLSGGMLALELYFDVHFQAWQIFIWTFVAGFFGLFFGNFFFKSLVLSDKYEWPFSKVNAAYISAFHDYKSVEQPERSSSVNSVDCNSTTRSAVRKQYGKLRIFALFFVVSFVWFVIPNYFFPALFSMSVLCWGAAAAGNGKYTGALPFGKGGGDHLFDVLGSGEAGAGIPGLGGWATVWYFGPSIIQLPHTVWIVVGVVLMNWILIPASFYMHMTAWPSSFSLFNKDGGYYNTTEGHYKATKEPVFISGFGLAMYAGVCMSVVATLCNTLIDCFLRLRVWTHTALNRCEVRSRRLHAAEKAIGTPLKIDERFQEFDSESEHSDDDEGGHIHPSPKDRSLSTSPRREILFSTDTNVSEDSATLPSMINANQLIEPMTTTTDVGSDRTQTSEKPQHQFQLPKDTRYFQAPMNIRFSCAVVSVLTVMAVMVVQFALPSLKDGTPGLGMPVFGTIACIVYSFMASYGVGLVQATSGQNLTGPVCILLQMLMGLFVPRPRANIVSVMICITVVSQSRALLSDLKTALYIGVRPRLVFYAQMLGALIGVVVSAAVFILVLHLNSEGHITIGSAEWPAVSASSQSLNAKIFGETGIGAVFQGSILYVLIPCLLFGIIGPILLRLVPEDVAWRRWLPDPVYLGIGGLCPGMNYSCMWMLFIAVLYQLYLRYKQPGWYAKYQYVSTSGVNAGVGLSSILVLLATISQLPAVQVGPQPKGPCHNLTLPAQTPADVACFNNNEGCNTPWPSN